MQRRTFFILVLIALFALVVVPLAMSAEPKAKAAEPKIIKIGALYPMTGRPGLYGLDSVEAAEMAIAEIQAKGGPAGYKIELYNTDCKFKPDYSVRVAKRYIGEEKVHFLFGVVSSAVGLAVSEVAKQNKKIFIGTDHATTRATTVARHPYYFRVSNCIFQSMAAGALYLKELKKTKPWETIAYIGPDYTYGQDQWNELRYNLDRFDVKYKVAGEYWPKVAEPDYTAFISAIIKDKPDVLVSGHFGGDSVAFIKQALPYGLFEKMIYVHPDAGGSYELMAAMGAEVPLGAAMSARHHNNWPETERNKKFVQDFFKRTDRYPSYAAEGAYAGIYAIAQAVEKVGNPNDTEALIKALEGMKIQLPEDPDGFCSYIDPGTHQIVQMQAVGVTVPNDKYPPAKRMLGEFKVFQADLLWPPPKDFVYGKYKK